MIDLEKSFSISHLDTCLNLDSRSRLRLSEQIPILVSIHEID